MKRIFALDYGRGTMAGFYTDFGAKVISPRPIMDKDGEPSGFALMQDGTYRLGKQLYTMGAKDYRKAVSLHINIKEIPTGDDALQVEYAKAWRQKLLRDNPTLFNDGSEEVWIIGCPTGWRSRKVIDKYRSIFEEAGFSNPIIVPESNAAMMYAQQTHEFMDHMGKNTGVLCIDLGAYSADSTYVRPGSVSSYGGYVGASLIEKMILAMNLSGEFCEDSRNSPNLRQKVREKCQNDPMFRAYMLLHAKKLKESYFTDVVNGQDYSDIDCTEAVDIRLNDAAFDSVGVKFFELVANEKMISTITTERSIKDILGEEFDVLPEEVRNELGEKSWRKSLESFVIKTLEDCPEFAAIAKKDPSGEKANLILTGGASLMPLVMDVMMEVMPNTNIYKDSEPMSTIAKGLVYFGPEKIKAMEFAEQYMWILTHDIAGNVSDSEKHNDLLNSLASRAHDTLVYGFTFKKSEASVYELVEERDDMGVVFRTVDKMILSVVNAASDWGDGEINSDQIASRALEKFNSWFNGTSEDSLSAVHARTLQFVKEFFAVELNMAFLPLLERYKLGATMLTASDLTLEYADDLLKWWKSNYETVFKPQIEDENSFYSQLPNPSAGVLAQMNPFGKSRQEEYNNCLEVFKTRNLDWRDKARNAFTEVNDKPENYGPFKVNCMAELEKAMNSILKTKLGELIVEDSFDDENENQ